MPTIVSGSISILSDAGLGMAMFSLGIYTYLLIEYTGSILIYVAIYSY